MTIISKSIHRNLKEYKTIRSLYKRAFPKKEQIPYMILRIMTRLKKVTSLAFYDNDLFCGFSYIIIQKQVVMIMYLAINDHLQNKGYGSQILDHIKSIYPNQTIILDVEELDYKADNARERLRRIEFYKRNGFYETNQYVSMRNVKYEIMSTDAHFTTQDYYLFWKNL